MYATGEHQLQDQPHSSAQHVFQLVQTKITHARVDPRAGRVHREYGMQPDPLLAVQNTPFL